MTDRILVFIPAYNCGPQIGRVLGQLASVPPGVIGRVLVLDNGSRDDTRERAAAAARALPGLDVVVGRNRANYGLGGSHKVAFAHAEAEGFTHVVVLHGDDQGSIADLVPVLEQGDHRRFDACLGARFMRGSRLVNYSWFRIFGNVVFNALFSLASLRRVVDLGSGLNVFARRVFADPAVMRHADDLRFNVYLLLGMFDRKCRVMFFPISWREDDQVSNVKMVSQSVRTLQILAEFVGARRFFRAGEHRAVVHGEYGFDVVWASGSGLAAEELPVG